MSSRIFSEKQHKCAKEGLTLLSAMIEVTYMASSLMFDVVDCKLVLP